MAEDTDGELAGGAVLEEFAEGDAAEAGPVVDIISWIFICFSCGVREVSRITSCISACFDEAGATFEGLRALVGVVGGIGAGAGAGGGIGSCRGVVPPLGLDPLFAIISWIFFCLSCGVNDVSLITA